MSEALTLGWMIVAWAIVVVVGAVLCFYSLRSWRRTGSRPMLLLGLGFVVLSGATAAAWIGLYVAFDDPFTAAIGCTVTLTAGFAMMLYALRLPLVSVAHAP
jgi:hypothetical protein